jgi:prolyl oligopeptidase PreP (S9A serine peptidase family)
LLLVVGAAWLNSPKNDSSHRRCYVIANIRGGGEFGPTWHQAALKENRFVNLESGEHGSVIAD